MKDFLAKLLLSISALIFILAVFACAISAYLLFHYGDTSAETLVLWSAALVVLGSIATVLSTDFRKMVWDVFLNVTLIGFFR